MIDSTIISLLKDSTTQNEGFVLLINQYKEKLYWHIRRIVISHNDADDVIQNVFIKVFKNIHSFKGQSSLYTWIFRIATNESLSFIRKKQRQSMFIEYAELVESTLSSDPYFNGDDVQKMIKKVIARLPEKQMLVFNLRYYEEMKYEDISTVLGGSVGGLKASYHHALKKVKKYIKSQNIQYEG